MRLIVPAIFGACLVIASEAESFHARNLSLLKRVHAFYYLWYGNPDTDGKWIHWDHHLLPHWTEVVRARYPKDVRYIPPEDAHSPYFPSRGLYSSRDPLVTRSHFDDMREHGIGVAVISWWGRPEVSKGDSQGVVTDALTQLVLDTAQQAGIKVALHLEPYEGRSAEMVRQDLEYLHHMYGAHPALLRIPTSSGHIEDGGGQQAAEAGDEAGGRPLYYVYDSYHIPVEQWQRLLTPAGDLSIRDTAVDVFAIGLWLEGHHGRDLAAAGFDGAYSYFATDGFSAGSTTARWPDMARFARENGLSLSLSVSPGYDDSKIRPWNAHNKRDRGAGQYYDRMWEAAVSVNEGVGPDFISVTTYNEWGEGTQIEGAVTGKKVDVDELAPLGRALNRTVRQVLGISDRYADYEDAGGPQGYMIRTQQYVQEWEGRLQAAAAREARGQQGGHTGEQGLYRDEYGQEGLRGEL